MSCNTECKKPSTSQAHCSACHTTYATVALFDEHRADSTITAQTNIKRGDGKGGQRLINVCADPESLNLIEAYGAWNTVDGAEKLAASVARLHSRV